MQSLRAFVGLIFLLSLLKVKAQNGCAQQDSECAFQYTINVQGSGNIETLTDTTIELSNVTLINSIEIELASKYGEDLAIILTTPTKDGRREEYIPMEDTKATSGTGDLEDFDLGKVAGDGTLSNVAPYIFVETGGLTGFTAPYSEPNTYNAKTWGSGNHYGGSWNLKILDNAEGDLSSIASITLKYCASACDANVFPTVQTIMPTPAPTPGTTSEPPTPVPQTPVPPTTLPPIPVPTVAPPTPGTTLEPPTPVPPTPVSLPPTPVPPTNEPPTPGTTLEPPVPVPPTSVPPTVMQESGPVPTLNNESEPTPGPEAVASEPTLAPAASPAPILQPSSPDPTSGSDMTMTLQPTPEVSPDPTDTLIDATSSAGVIARVSACCCLLCMMFFTYHII